MVAHRADLGGLLADVDVTAVAALPDHVALAAEHQAAFDVAEQLAVALLVFLFDGRDALELPGDVLKALRPGLLGELPVHVGPLEVLAVGGIVQVGRGGGHLAAVEQLEPHFGVLLLVLRGLLEDRGDLHIAVLLGLGSIVIVLVAGLGFAREGRHQVGLGP